MSYTESDVINSVYEDIKNNRGIFNITSELIRWYEKQKSLEEVNGRDTKDLIEKIKVLRNKL